MKCSVVLPVLRPVPGIARCLDGFSAQTDQDWELLFIQGNDPVSALSGRDERFRALSFSGVSVGEALNEGLAAASGGWVLFAGPECVPEPELISRAVAEGEKAGADLVCFGWLAENATLIAAKENIDESLPRFAAVSEESRGEQIMPLLDRLPAKSGCRLYRRAFLEGSEIRFGAFPGAEGAPFLFSALSRARTVACLPEALIRYPGKRVRGEDLPAGLLFIREDLESSGLWASLAPVWRGWAAEASLALLSDPKADPAAVASLLTALKDDVRLAACTEGPFLSDASAEKAKLLSDGLGSALPVFTSRTAALREQAPRVLCRASVSDPEVSVMMPVYNGAEFLNESLSSVLSQTFENWELVCVNDGSTDQTERILLDHASRDQRITVCSQPNRGVAAARNACIAAARGKWLYFLDSDDTLDPGALTKLTAVAEREDPDLILFPMRIATEDGYTPDEAITRYVLRHESLLKRIGELAPEKPVPGGDLFLLMKENGAYICNPVLRFVRRAYLASLDVSFIPGIIHEDQPHSLQELIRAERALLLPEPMYTRRLRPDSIMTSAVSFRNALGYAMGSDAIRRFALSSVREDALRAGVLDHADMLLEKAAAIDAGLSQAERASAWGLPDVAARRIYASLITAPNRASDRLEDAKSRLTDTKQKLSESRDRLSETKEKLSESLNRLSEVKGKLTETKQKLEDSRAKLTASREKNREIGEALDLTKQKYKKAKRRLASAREQLAESRSQVASLASSRDYRLGRALLRVPRKVSSLFGRKQRS